MPTMDEILGAIRSVLDNVEWREHYRPRARQILPALDTSAEAVAMQTFVNGLDDQALRHLEAAIKARRAEPPVSGPSVEYV